MGNVVKFTKLSVQFNKLWKSKEKGKKIDANKLAKLIKHLRKKISTYERKILLASDPEKRNVFETRLKVVKVQLKKAQEIERSNNS